MGKTVMGAVVSLDGVIADDADGIGPLFDWLGNDDLIWSLPGSDDEMRTTRASTELMRTISADIAVNLIGRRLFHLTNGWNGKPTAGERVIAVTHEAPADWEYAGSEIHP